MLYAIQCSVEGGYEELAQRHALPAVLPDRLDGHTGSYNHIVDRVSSILWSSVRDSYNNVCHYIIHVIIMFMIICIQSDDNS